MRDAMRDALRDACVDASATRGTRGGLLLSPVSHSLPSSSSSLSFSLFFHFCYVLHSNLISVLFPRFLSFFYIYLSHQHSPPVQLPHPQVFLRYCQNSLSSELLSRVPWQPVHALLSPEDRQGVLRLWGFVSGYRF